MSPLVGLFIVVLLVAANGFFVATEFALVTSRSTRIDQLAASGSRAARMVQHAKNNPAMFISGTQLGVTMASLILGWLGEQTFAELLQPPLNQLAVLFGFTNAVLRVIRIEYQGEEHAVHSPDELLLLVSRSARAGLLEPAERELVQRAFAFSDQTAGEVMVPRTEIVALPVDSSVEEAIKIALRYRYSRFPVFDKTIDNVVGMLSSKDLLGVAARRAAPTSLQDISLRRLIRPPIVVPQGASTTEVLARMKANRLPMAVVLDEYGGTAGIVTLKDLVERLLGSVGDEYTPATHEVRTLADGTIVADGLALVEDVNAQLGTHFDDSEVDSLGGLVFSRLGRRPQVGDEVDIGGSYRARVERLDGLRIARVRLLPPKGGSPNGQWSGARDQQESEQPADGER